MWNFETMIASSRKTMGGKTSGPSLSQITNSRYEFAVEGRRKGFPLIGLGKRQIGAFQRRRNGQIIIIISCIINDYINNSHIKYSFGARICA